MKSCEHLSKGKGRIRFSLHFDDGMSHEQTSINFPYTFFFKGVQIIGVTQKLQKNGAAQVRKDMS